jgi:GrpB-like predicted nucleotidyltransferase (UPF0157 family)
MAHNPLIMASPIPVFFVEHDCEWPSHARAYARKFCHIGSVVIAIHHIGSTSVPGIVAKPVIDLMPIVANLPQFEQMQDQVEALGFKWHGEFGVPGRRFCTLDDEQGHRLANIHCYQPDSIDARKQLVFRNYLRHFPDIAAAYQKEKKRCQALYPDNSVAYSAEKGEWIRRVLVDAFAWQERQSGNADILTL